MDIQVTQGAGYRHVWHCTCPSALRHLQSHPTVKHVQLHAQVWALFVRTHVSTAACPLANPTYMLSLLPCTAAVSVVGGGEASGPLSPPDKLSEECFSAGEAAAAAYKAAGLGPQQIDYWGLYDCFPICFVR